MMTAPDNAQTSTASSSKAHLEPDMNDSDSGVHSCEFCGTSFETRRGFSSHARSHLRQLGVALSDSSGAPIDLLYQVMKERGGTLPKVEQVKPLKKYKTKATIIKKEAGPKLKIKISNLVKKKYALSSSLVCGVKKSVTGHAGGKPRKPPPKKIVVSKTASTLEALDSRLGDSRASSSLSMTSPKPLWAPQETDAPLILSTTTNFKSKDNANVCELCGAWYETHKGLCSHARSHLRNFGINLDSKSAPIEALHQFIHSEDFQKKASTWEQDTDFEDWMSLASNPSTSKKPTPPLSKKLSFIRSTPQAAKQQNASLSLSKSLPINNKAKVQPHLKDKKQKISSGSSENTAISDQIEISPPSSKEKKKSQSFSEILPLSGKSELTLSPPLKKKKVSTDFSSLIEGAEIKSTPLVKKQTVSTDSSLILPIGNEGDQRLENQGGSSKYIECEFCPEKLKKISSMASHARYHLRQMGITEWYVKGSPIATLREVMSQRPFTPLSSRTLPSLKPVTPTTPISVAPLQSTPVSPPSSPFGSHKVPKAKKGSCSVIPKHKEEPVEVDVSIIEPTKLQPVSSLSSGTTTDISATNATKLEQLEPVCCDYCGEMFSTRKALSCHARSHLKQLGATWSMKYPPIEALNELMKREGSARASQIQAVSVANMPWKKKESSPQGFSPSLGNNSAAGCDATCELCGFDFENRKALASHARAHLRQLGVDWKIMGSPIETLSDWMKRKPEKVAELHKSYMRGKLPFVKKGRRRTSTTLSASDSESVRSGCQKLSSAVKDSAGHIQVFHHSKVAKAGTSQSSSKWLQHSSDELPSESVQTPTALRDPKARSNRGFDRRPPKHLSGSLGTEPSKPTRAGNIPSLVPRPPATSLVKLVGKIYSLKCRFCEEVFQGPLSIQEDWVMHLQQHILKLKKDQSTSPPSPPPLVPLKHHC